MHEQEIIHTQRIGDSLYCFCLLVEYDVEKDKMGDGKPVEYPINEGFDLERSFVYEMRWQKGEEDLLVPLKPLLTDLNKNEVFERIEIC